LPRARPLAWHRGSRARRESACWSQREKASFPGLIVGLEPGRRAGRRGDEMARVKVRFSINKGRHGAPMAKLSKISEQAEMFASPRDRVSIGRRSRPMGSAIDVAGMIVDLPTTYGGRAARGIDEAGREDLPNLADAVAFALRLHAEAKVAAAPCRRETRTGGRPRAAQPECEVTGTAAGRVAKLTTAETTTLTINAAKPMLMSSALAGRNGNRLTNVPWGVNVT
jgi:hypothetical protein